ncbi:hypothetical protein L1987_67854 [Smallanthus sonchifolius]|uniref:Uncharacterized protein n=1 Tax=Smallanthus sonchifolius TaxID=185202 RepID=A0ACB9B3I0_9ASTR|nr:hypothetical protein L1987_67854 [Smallanthus sonchifolius]
MPESKKVVIKVDIHDENDKRKVLKAVSGLCGIESLDIKDEKLTIVGNIDPVKVVGKLKKWHANILVVGPAKEEKKEPAKKEPEKKDDEKKKKQEEEEAVKRWMEACRVYNPYPPPRYCVHSMEEDPNSCVIC